MKRKRTRSWIGRRNRKKGGDFERIVCNEFVAHGWDARKVGCQQQDGRTKGDLQVHGLGRVECKDVQKIGALNWFVEDVQAVAMKRAGSSEIFIAMRLERFFELTKEGTNA